MIRIYLLECKYHSVVNSSTVLGTATIYNDTKVSQKEFITKAKLRALHYLLCSIDPAE